MSRHSSSRLGTRCSRRGSPPRSSTKGGASDLTGQPEASTEPYREQLLAIGRHFGVEMPLDKAEADVHADRTAHDIEHYPKAVAALARGMQHLAGSRTFRSEGLIAENYGYYAGARSWHATSA